MTVNTTGGIRFDDSYHKAHREASARYCRNNPDKVKMNTLRQRKHRSEHLEEHREYHKNYHRNQLILLKTGQWVKADCKPPRPKDVCDVCGKEAKKLYYHHWDDSLPEAGMWVCHTCHAGCEFVDKDYHTKYLRTKSIIMTQHDIKQSSCIVSNT